MCVCVRFVRVRLDVWLAVTVVCVCVCVFCADKKKLAMMLMQLTAELFVTLTLFCYHSTFATPCIIINNMLVIAFASLIIT